MHCTVKQINRRYKSVINSRLGEKDIRLNGVQPVRVTIQVGGAGPVRGGTNCRDARPTIALDDVLMALVTGSQHVRGDRPLENLLSLFIKVWNLLVNSTTSASVEDNGGENEKASSTRKTRNETDKVGQVGVKEDNVTGQPHLWYIVFLVAVVLIIVGMVVLMVLCSLLLCRQKKRKLGDVEQGVYRKYYFEEKLDDKKKKEEKEEEEEAIEIAD